jgi:glycine cleavage system H protein
LKIGQASRKGLYFTRYHEWIDFQGAVAYTGVGAFKLLGFKEVHEIVFGELSGFKNCGDLIATIRYKDYRVKACMPVDGKILKLNEVLFTGNQKILLQYPETSGWIALISPSRPYDRNGLLLPKEYQMGGKIKHTK